MAKFIFKEEIKIGVDIYAEELKRTIEKNKRDLDYIMALKKALDEDSNDQKIKEIHEEHKLFKKVKKREEEKSKRKNSENIFIHEDIKRGYVKNEKSFSRLMNSYLKVIKRKTNRKENDEVLNRKTNLSYKGIHRPLILKSSYQSLIIPNID